MLKEILLSRSWPSEHFGRAIRSCIPRWSPLTSEVRSVLLGYDPCFESFSPPQFRTALLRTYSAIFSFQTAALSTPANPLRNDLDKPQTSDDGQSNKQIKIFFRHCPCVSVRGQSNAGTATKWAENCAH